jgi:hypothetical protein
MRIPSAAFLIIALSAAFAAAQDLNKPIRIGEIEFFGSAGFDLDRIRKALPLHEGESITLSDLKLRVKPLNQAITQAIGKPATDIAPGCCDDRGDWMIYIGLPGKSSVPAHYNPQPTSGIQFAARIVNLYDEAVSLGFEAAQKQAAEDRSKGYALSFYPPLRAKQLAAREFALRNDRLIIRVLREAGDAQQRRVAAHLLGYAPQSQRQLEMLVFASNDADDVVRNNAVRALMVLAESSPKIAARIPRARFISMLNSGIWKDRNKGGLLLETLSRGREPGLLNLLKQRALDSLIEMARWRSPGHAYPARAMLARIAGVDAEQGRPLTVAETEAIIRAAQQKP